MHENFYQQALYVVKDGNEDLFIAAWDKFINALAEASVAQFIKGTLIQNQSNSKIFYSFGSWESLEPIKNLQQNTAIKNTLSNMSNLCEKVEADSYTIVREFVF